MIEVKNIQKAFGQEQVLKGISFEMEAEETLGILGKSGCGKTTLLKILAGLEEAGEGAFRINGRELMGVKPQERQVVYLSQEPLLFPHLTVFENVAFGLRLRKVAGAEVKAQVEALLEQTGLAAQAGKMPQALSGGQRQRVAFARAIIIRPPMMLLDEPFGSLDSQTRGEMQVLYQQLRSTHRITSLFVTHDLREALLMGDRIGKMDAGKLVVYKTKQAFIEAPDSGVQEELEFWKRLMNLKHA